MAASSASHTSQTGRIESLRAVNDPTARGDHLSMKSVNIRAARGGQGDHLDGVRVRSVKPNDVMLVVTVRLEPGQTIVAGDFHQPPMVQVERALRVEVLDTISDEAKLGHSAHITFLWQSDGL